MKTNLTSENPVRQEKRNGRKSLMRVVICMACIWGLHVPLMAQESDPYVIYVAQAPGAVSTEVTVWFYDVVNSTKYTITSAETGVNITAGANGTVNSGEESKTFTVTFNGGQLPAGDHVFTLTMMNDNCATPQDFTVRVKDFPVLTFPALSDVCNVASNVNVTGTISGTDGASEVKYIWSAVQATTPAVAEITFSAGNETAELAYTAGSALITGEVKNSSKQPVTIKYKVTPIAYYTTNPGEEKLRVTGELQEVTLKVYPTVTFTSDLAFDVCSNMPKSYTATSDITGASVSYAWSRAAVTGISNTAANGMTAEFTETLVNTSNAPVEATYVYTLKMDNQCPSDFNVVATVKPTPALASAVIDAVCSGGEVAFTPASTATGVTMTYSWTRASVEGISEAPVTNGTGSVAETLTNTTKAPVEVTYKYNMTADGCPGAETDVKVWVNPLPDLTLPADLTVCNGTTLDLPLTSGLAVTDGATNQVTWTAVAAGEQATISGQHAQTSKVDIAGLKISDQLTNTGTGTGSVTYAVTQYYTAHGKTCTAATPEEVVVTVVPKIEVVAVDEQIVCSENPVNAVNFSTNLTGGLSVTYAWDFQYKPSELEVTGGTSVTTVGDDLNEVKGAGDFTLTLVKNKKTDNTPVVVSPVHVEAAYTVAEGNVCKGENVFGVTVNPKPSFRLGKRPASVH